jgi:hypothetical protein
MNAVISAMLPRLLTQSRQAGRGRDDDVVARFIGVPQQPEHGMEVDCRGSMKIWFDMLMLLTNAEPMIGV